MSTISLSRWSHFTIHPPSKFDTSIHNECEFYSQQWNPCILQPISWIYPHSNKIYFWVFFIFQLQHYMFSNCMYLEYTLKKPREAQVFKKCCNVCQIIFIARTCVHVRYIYMYVYRPVIGCIHFSINWQMQYCSAFSQITF